MSNIVAIAIRNGLIHAAAVSSRRINDPRGRSAGIDLRRAREAGWETARLGFDVSVLSPAAARQALVELAQRARGTPGG